jgi:hypothetical protein
MSHMGLRDTIESFGVTNIAEEDMAWLLDVVGRADYIAPQDAASRNAVNNLGNKLVELVDALRQVEATAKMTTHKDGSVNVATEFVAHFAGNRESVVASIDCISKAIMMASDTGVPLGKGAPPKHAWNEYASAMIAVCRGNAIGIESFIDLLDACQFVIPEWARTECREATRERFKGFRKTHIHNQSDEEFRLKDWLDSITTQHVFPEGK